MTVKEHVAFAIFVAGGGCDYYWDDIPSHVQKRYLHMADAGIEILQQEMGLIKSTNNMMEQQLKAKDIAKKVLKATCGVDHDMVWDCPCGHSKAKS